MRALIILSLAIIHCNAEDSQPPKGWPAGVQEITYLASIDNSQQPALIHITEREEKRPLLVALHTWSGNYRQAGGQTAFAKWSIKNNWHMIHPNFRGPNNNPDGCGSDKAVQDILDAVDYMKKNHSVDEDRIYLVGSSGGGHCALLMAGRAPNVWAGVSSWVPISDVRAWWEHTSQAKMRYARDIEKAVGGAPDQDKNAAAECTKRSPITYLHQAVKVNLDINAGVFDGRKGSVPFTHSLNAFNAVVPVDDKISQHSITSFYKEQKPLPGEYELKPDPLYEKNPVIYRKISANTRVTIFKGGHEIIHKAALNWLAAQRRGKPAIWKVKKASDFTAKEKDSESGL